MEEFGNVYDKFRNKTVYPGLWECTGGSAKAEGSSIEAVIREIYEEIGIDVKPTEGKLLGTIQRSNYFRDVWKFKKDVQKKILIIMMERL